MDILNELKALLTSGLAEIKEQIEQVDHDDDWENAVELYQMSQYEFEDYIRVIDLFLSQVGINFEDINSVVSLIKWCGQEIFEDEYKQEVLNKSYKLLTNSTD